MSSIRHIPLDGNHDLHQQPQLIPFFPTYEPSSFTYPLPFHTSQAGDCHHHDLHQQQEDDVENFPSGGGSSDPLLLLVSLPTTANDEPNLDNRTKQFMRDGSKSESVKWMSSKMRLMRKMMNSDRPVIRKPRRNTNQVRSQDQQQQSSTENCSSSSGSGSSSNGIIRVCSDCKTTKTPLWRSGPQGPKSLCNACGIRQRKARKALATAAAAAEAMSGESLGKDKGLEGDHVIVPFKKRCKFSSPGPQGKIGTDDFAINLNQSPHVHKVFPQDEKEAAILLMALSCGLVCR